MENPDDDEDARRPADRRRRDGEKASEQHFLYVGVAVRAVGSANGANPIGLVVPCHRVIAADGTLGGYGGGLEMKTWLLRHEGALGCNETRRAS